VLSEIITRIRGQDGTVSLVTAYDYHGRVWNPPMPLLFQRHYGGEHHAIGGPAIRELISDALTSTGITDASGKPLRFVPHDFRRIFITDAIMHGMPPHIAQLVAGHRYIGVTLGYKPSTPRRSSTPTGHSSPGAARCGRPRNTAPPPKKNGPSSSATSSGASCRWAPAAAPTPPPAPVSAARCCGPTPPSGHGWPRSATT
jgi:hypothetical protein